MQSGVTKTKVSVKLDGKSWGNVKRQDGWRPPKMTADINTGAVVAMTASSWVKI